MNNSTLFRVKEAKLKPAVKVLVSAFYNDPLYVAIIPKAGLRRQFMTALFNATARYALRHGEIWATSPQLEGVAVWFPPGKTDLPTQAFLSFGVLSTIVQAFFTLGFRRISRTLRFQNTVVEYHDSIKEPHWYLLAIGVRPELHGRGYGSRLLAPALARADAQGQACYLETQNAPNVVFYEKRGFQVLKTIYDDNSDLTIWTMLRPPQG